MGKFTFAFLAVINFITTAWIGQNHTDNLPVIAYGVVLLFCAIAYFILQAQIIKSHDDQFALRKVIGTDTKGKISILFYTLGILSGFFNVWIALLLYAVVAIMWLVPDPRIEESV